MVTDGVDDYEPRYNPEDPYVQAAIEDSVRAHLIVYSIYWRNSGFLDRTSYGRLTARTCWRNLPRPPAATATGRGTEIRSAFEPYLSDIDRRIHNQYELNS